VPPVAPIVYVVPSEPLSVTCVAFLAVMVRMDELPAVIDAGFAAIATVGVAELIDDTVMVEFAVAEPADPVAVAV
jgi:thiazole synthase ThiGH ThiG subunit